MTSPSMPISTWRMASLSKSSTVLLSAVLVFTPICGHPSAFTEPHHLISVVPPSSINASSDYSCRHSNIPLPDIKSDILKSALHWLVG